MRKLMTRTVLMMLALVVFSSSAFAAPIPIGYLVWTVTVPPGPGPGSGLFSIVNQSGTNSTLDPDFPVTTQLLFNSVDMILILGLAGPPFGIAMGQSSMTTPDGGLSWDSPDLLGLGAVPIDAVVGGTVLGGPVVTEWDGSLWSIVGSILMADATLTPITSLNNGGAPLADGASAILYVEGTLIPAAPSEVPEPATLMLLGTGVVGLIAVRRRQTAKS